MMLVQHIARGCLILGLILAGGSARAQVVQFEFTGSLVLEEGDFGESVMGVVTLDLDATIAEADSYFDYSTFEGEDCGERASWKNGNFALEAITSSGRMAGTSLGGDTYFENFDRACRNPPQHLTIMHCHAREGDIELGMYFITEDYDADDGLASPADWTPLDDEFTYIRVYWYDYGTNEFEYGNYVLDTFDLVRDTIVIDGCDTGVEDFEYDGRLVSEILDELATDARSHGQYVAKVKKLLRDLYRANLITGEDAELIQHCAEESTAGTRPQGKPPR